MNPNPHCRIGKVRPKDAPHLVEIIPAKRGMEYRQTMHQHADLVCDYLSDVGIAGFAIVAWGFDGTFSRGSRIHKDSFIGQTLMPPVVADILRRDTAADAAADVFTGQL